MKKFSVFLLTILTAGKMSGMDNHTAAGIALTEPTDLPTLCDQLNSKLERSHKDFQNIILLSEKIRLLALVDKLSFDPYERVKQSIIQSQKMDDSHIFNRNIDTLDELLYPINLFNVRFTAIEWAKQQVQEESIDEDAITHKIAILDEEKNKIWSALVSAKEMAPEKFPELENASIASMLQLCKISTAGEKSPILRFDKTTQKAICYYLFVMITADELLLGEEYIPVLRDFIKALSVRFENRQSRAHYRWILSAIRFAQEKIEATKYADIEDLSWVKLIVGSAFIKQNPLLCLSGKTLKPLRLAELAAQKEDAIRLLTSYEKRNRVC
jgi:hypothetical protein